MVKGLLVLYVFCAMNLMTNPKDNALRDELAEETYYKCESNFYSTFASNLIGRRGFKNGWDAAEANLLSTHPVVLELVKALEYYAEYMDPDPEIAREALEAAGQR